MNRLRQLRKEQKITLKEFGKIFGLAESTISLYENEKRQPDTQTLQKFADYFGVSVDYLLGRDDVSIEPSARIKEDETSLDSQLVTALTDLTPDEFQRVADFIAGMKAARKK